MAEKPNTEPNTAMDQANREAKERLVAGLRGRGAHLNFESAVADMPGRLYNAKPDNVPYTFWHQLEHIRICQWDILEYIRNPGFTSPPWPEGYWPAQDAEADSAGWKKTIEEYQADRDELIRLVEADELDVLAPVPHNRGRSVMGSVLIVIDHNAYHLGEFVMGRQIMGAWKSELA